MKKTKEKILEAYNFRHACKEFDKDKKIPEDDFNFLLEIARLSPSSFGFEPWRFLIVQDRDLREKIAPVSWGAVKQLPTASHFVIILAKKDSEMLYNSDYVEYIMKDVHNIPEDKRKLRRERYRKFQEDDFKLLEREGAVFQWSSKQTYIVLGNMMTAAAQIGIDSCPIEGFDREKLEEILEEEGIIDREKYGVSIMVAFGYRKEEPKRAKSRQDMEKIVQWL